MTPPAIARTLHGYRLIATGQTYRRKRDALSHGLEALHRIHGRGFASPRTEAEDKPY